MKTPMVGLAAVVFLACSLAGCSYGADAVTCPSWVSFPTPQEKYDAAALVIVTSSSTRDGTTPIYGVDAHSYDVLVDEVLKGALRAGTVRISSMPDSCSGTAEYPHGDPLDTTDALLVFAQQYDGEWFTLTPFDGTLPLNQETFDSIER